jgi:hypothetical protein
MQNNRLLQTTTHKLNRRQFLTTLGLSVSAGWLTACAPARTTPIPRASPLPAHPILPSPQPAGTATPLPATEGLPLTDFLALSALLTGVDELNPQLGSVYLQSLQASTQFEVTLAELYRQAGFGTGTRATTIEELETNGLFAQEPTRKLANKIIEYWYTGIYDTAEGEQAVATFVDALAWQTLAFTKPLTICGVPDFWAQPPEQVRS